jgi:hypothetical protein
MMLHVGNLCFCTGAAAPSPRCPWIVPVRCLAGAAGGATGRDRPQTEDTFRVSGFGFRDVRCFETEVRRQEKGLFVGWRDDLRVVRVRGGCMSCPWSGQRALYGRSMHGLRAAKLELGVPRRWVRSGRRTLLIREAGWNVIHLNPVLNAPLTRYT